MTTFNSTFDWDSNLPSSLSSLSSLDENDFLLLLQKQFPAVNSQPIDPGVLAKANPEDVAANSQSISKFHLPNTTSPLSTDSSPSPPSANDDNVSFNGSDGNNNTSAGQSKQATPPTDDDHHKRKASADDFDDEINGQPSAKSQHTDPKKKVMQARRKSGGPERGQDESRLLKRKEQNRAAQRAFRERKEKHVKDLEDKVAQLEAKTETQATENDHLRDMLSRLQNENVALKQATFTFSVPSTSTATTAVEPTRDPSHSSSESLNNLFASSSSSTAGPSRVPGSARSSVATASTHDSPTSIFEGYSITSADVPSASGASSTTNPSPSAHDLETMSYFGSPGPFTTIASNPMFTSYRDPMQSMNAFASFPGWDGDVNMPGPSSTTNDPSLEDLFGGQFASLIPFGSDYSTGEGKEGASVSPGVNAVSPIGIPKPPLSHEHGDGSGCPKTKQDVEKLIANGPKGTFGSSPLPLTVAEDNSPTAPSLSRQNSHGNEYKGTYQQPLDNPADPKPFCDNFNIDELCLEMQRKAKCSNSNVACNGPNGI